MDVPLSRIGLDSLMAVELRNRVRSQLELDVPLVTFMDDASITRLATELSLRLAAIKPVLDRKADSADLRQGGQPGSGLCRRRRLSPFWPGSIN